MKVTNPSTPGKPARKLRQWAIALTLLGSIAFLSIAWANPRTRLTLLDRLGVVLKVNEIQQASQLSGASVRLQGKVGDRIPLIGQQIYQLEDETGRVLVVTSSTALRSGDTVRIRGTLRFESIPIAGKEMGGIYIEETERITHP